MMSRPAVNPGSKRSQFPISATLPLEIVGATAFGRYPKISAEQTYNMMISDNALVPFPGYKQVAQIVKNGTAREVYSSSQYNHLIVVIDDGVYTVSTNFAVAKIATLDTSNGNVFIAENLAGQIAIADGLRIYIFDYINNTFTVPEIDFLPVYISFQDTYFIAADGRTNKWRLSDNNNGNSWKADAAHTGELQTKSTTCVAVTPLDRQLFVIGKTVAEPWYDVGYSLFPYQRTNFYNIDYGTLSSATIATGFNKMVWLGSNEKGGIAIMYSQGGQPQQISTDGLDFEFSKLTRPDDSFGFLFKIDGHIFYQLTFRTDNITYVYDFNTGKFFTLTDENLNHHIAKRVAFFNGQNYFVSFTDGNLYEISSSYYTYNGAEIPRFRILKNLRLPTSDLFVVNNITLTLEQGMQSSDLPVSNTVQRVDLSVSKDGGQSFGNVVSKKLNQPGQRINTFNFWNIGAANDLVLKFGFWGFGRFVVIGGQASLYA